MTLSYLFEIAYFSCLAMYASDIDIGEAYFRTLGPLFLGQRFTAHFIFLKHIHQINSNWKIYHSCYKITVLVVV